MGGGGLLRHTVLSMVTKYTLVHKLLSSKHFCFLVHPVMFSSTVDNTETKLKSELRSMFSMTENRLPLLVSTRVHTLGIGEPESGKRDDLWRWKRCGRAPETTSKQSHGKDVKYFTCSVSAVQLRAVTCVHSVNNVITASDLYGKLLLDN